MIGGSEMKNNKKLVVGVAVNDYKGSVSVDGNTIRSYRIWYGILTRCYNDKFHEKNPTYKGCSVAKDWLLFSNFKKWYDDNYPSVLSKKLGIAFEIDKDLLSKGNKVYSQQTCVFIPSKVNNFMTNNKKSNKSGYTGVSWYKRYNKWLVQIKDFETGKTKKLGYFKNVEEASSVYKKAREAEAVKCKEFLKSLNYDEELIKNIE